MKKWLLLLSAALLFTSSAWAKEKLVFSTINGISIIGAGEQFLKEAYQQLNIDISVEEYPGERSLVAANTGKTDGELGRIAGIEKEYPNLIMVPVPILRLSISAFSNKQISIANKDDLKKYRIGFVAGTKIVENMTNEVPHRMRVSRPDQLFQMLLLNRIDVAIDMTEDGLVLMKSDKYKMIKPVSPILEQGDVFHYLNKKHADIVPKITSVLKNMADKGILKQKQDAFLADIKNTSPK